MKTCSGRLLLLIDGFVKHVKIQAIKGLLQSGRSLDVGCGDRTYTKHMPNAIGIDINKEFEGKTCNPDYWMDVRDLGFGNETFDNVCLLDTLEHILESDLVVKQVWRVLKHNGVLIIVDPNDAVLFWTRLLCGRFKDAFRGNPDHIHKFNKSSLVRLMSPLFKLEKIKRRGIFTGYQFRRIEVC